MTPKQKRLYLSILIRIAKKEKGWEEEKGKEKDEEEDEDVEMETEKGKETEEGEMEMERERERERKKKRKRREWLEELLNTSSHPKLSVDGYDEKARNLEKAGEGSFYLIYLKFLFFIFFEVTLILFFRCEINSSPCHCRLFQAYFLGKFI